VSARAAEPGRQAARPRAELLTGSGLTPRATRIRRLLFLLVAVVGVALVLARVVSPPASNPPLPAGGWAIDGVLMVGGQPSDRDLADLRDAFRVSAVINVRVGAMPVEHRTAESFGLEYRWLPLEPRERPRPVAVRSLATLVRTVRARGNAIIVHDAKGTERAPLVAAAILVTLGANVPAAVRRATHGDDEAIASIRRADRAWLRALARARS
jgi:hypothetical protein